jgi:DNA-binding response OmpR family regulator
LVAEDQALIGMALESYLQEAGIDVAGPFASCAAALSWTEERTPGLAILDFKLQDGPCTELAKTLLGRKVPIIIYSGLPRGPDTPSEFDGVTWLEKPIDRASLMAEAARLSPELARLVPVVA